MGGSKPNLVGRQHPLFSVNYLHEENLHLSHRWFYLLGWGGGGGGVMAQSILLRSCGDGPITCVGAGSDCQTAHIFSIN